MKPRTTARGALEVALAHVPTAAFVCSEQGDVLIANAPGTLWLAAEPAYARALAARPVDLFHIAPFAVGHDTQYLAILRAIDAFARWRFTRRERDVATLLLRGATNQTIAQVLACSLRTVEHHVSSMLRKVSVENRTSLIPAILQP